MEASAILKMIEDAYYNRFFIIDVIVSDDDSTMRAVLKHPIIGVRCQVLKTLKGKLDVQIPDPSFLFELPSKFFGHSCSSAYSTFFSAESHFLQALE